MTIFKVVYPESRGARIQDHQRARVAEIKTTNQDTCRLRKNDINIMTQVIHRSPNDYELEETSIDLPIDDWTWPEHQTAEAPQP